MIDRFAKHALVSVIVSRIKEYQKKHPTSDETVLAALVQVQYELTIQAGG